MSIPVSERSKTQPIKPMIFIFLSIPTALATIFARSKKAKDHTSKISLSQAQISPLFFVGHFNLDTGQLVMIRNHKSTAK